MRRICVAMILCVWLLLTPGLSFSQEEKSDKKVESTAPAKKERPKDAGDDGNNADVLSKEFAIQTQTLNSLSMLFAIAVLLESAFTLLFSWRVFLTYFSVAGLKTIVMLLIASAVVKVFQIDILADIVSIYKGSSVAGAPVSQLITAMILAGGSAGVNTILLKLGLRTKPVAPLSERPPATDAWIAVMVKRRRRTGSVGVRIKDLGEAKAGDQPIAGTACGKSPRLTDLLLLRRNRFPAVQGYPVTPGRQYEISVEAEAATGGLRVVTLGTYVFARGAVVDFDAVL